MQRHIDNRSYQVEILPPKQSSEKLDQDLESFASRYTRVLEAGYCACLTDNAMGHLAFQGLELIEELSLPVEPEQVMIHLNTFHTKEGLDQILAACRARGIKHLLVVSGDGSERLPKLSPADLGAPAVESVTSVELLGYIRRQHPGAFNLGVAFNPYEPEEHEFEKMKRKLAAGACFVITQPIIGNHPLLERLMEEVKLPLIVEAWMSKKLHLLSECVGYEIPEDTAYDPVANLKALHAHYPGCGVYLALLGFKSQFPILKSIWV